MWLEITELSNQKASLEACSTDLLQDLLENAGLDNNNNNDNHWLCATHVALSPLHSGGLTTNF